MRRRIRAGLLALIALLLGAPAALAFGPQLMPDDACNAERVGYYAQGEFNVVPHWKDWDGDQEKACYHLNSNPNKYPPGGPWLE